MIYEKFLSQFTDWRPDTLYWQKFSIAEKYGKAEILAVYTDLFAEAKKDYKLLTELTMVLNHKSWQHCKDLENSSFCTLYTDLFRTVKEYAETHLKGKELNYFLKILD